MITSIVLCSGYHSGYSIYFKKNGVHKSPRLACSIQNVRLEPALKISR